MKNQANKHEIIEETLAVVPKWFSLAKQTEQSKSFHQLQLMIIICLVDTNPTNLLLSTVRSLDDFPKNLRLKMLCECSTILLNFNANLSEECCKNVDGTIEFIIDQLEDYDSALRFAFNILMFNNIQYTLNLDCQSSILLRCIRSNDLTSAKK